MNQYNSNLREIEATLYLLNINLPFTDTEILNRMQSIFNIANKYVPLPNAACNKAYDT